MRSPSRYISTSKVFGTNNVFRKVFLHNVKLSMILRSKNDITIVVLNYIPICLGGR